MEDIKLLSLLEEDKELLLENLIKDRRPEAAQTALETEINRILYRFCEACPDEALNSRAQAILATLKGAVPLLGTVDDVEEWQRSTAAQQEKEKKLRPLALVLAVVGLGLVLAAVLVLMKQGEGGLTLPLLAPPLLGAVCLFLGGLWLIRGKKRKAADEIKREFHVNPAAIYRALQGVLMAADKDLKEAAELARLEKQREESAASALSTDETELFAGLLEAAYARRGASDGADAEEIIANIRYYLYKRNVETLDYSGEKAAWFECLPARRSGTIRPALVSGGRLLKKGLASAKEG